MVTQFNLKQYLKIVQITLIFVLGLLQPFGKVKRNFKPQSVKSSNIKLISLPKPHLNLNIFIMKYLKIFHSAPPSCLLKCYS